MSSPTYQRSEDPLGSSNPPSPGPRRYGTIRGESFIASRLGSEDGSLPVFYPTPSGSSLCHLSLAVPGACGQPTWSSVDHVGARNVGAEITSAPTSAVTLKRRSPPLQPLPSPPCYGLPGGSRSSATSSDHNTGPSPCCILRPSPPLFVPPPSSPSLCLYAGL